jgi:hypothetical protein
MSNSVTGQSSEVLIPRSQEFIQMRFGDAQNLVAFVRAKTARLGEFQRIEPKLRRAIIALDVNMRRLVTICLEEEKPVAVLAQSCWDNRSFQLSFRAKSRNLCLPPRSSRLSSCQFEAPVEQDETLARVACLRSAVGQHAQALAATNGNVTAAAKKTRHQPPHASSKNQ